MRLTTRRRSTATAVWIALLVAALPLQAHAGSPARQYFAPAKQVGEPARVRTPRSGALRKVSNAAVLRHVLHPVRTFRRAGASAKEGVLRAVDHVQIAHVERQIRRRGTADVPSRQQIRRAHLQQRKWKRTAAAGGKRFEPTDGLLVASDHDVDTPLASGDLAASAARLRASVSESHALLPVDITPSHVDSLVAAALDAVGDRSVYGAPDGVSDILENHTVAFDVVDRTFEAARAGDHRGTGWLTANQRAVLEDVMAEGDEGAAKELLHGAYTSAVEVAVSGGETYKAQALRMDGELPLEVQAAIAQRPALAAQLRALEARGVKLQLRTMEHTPIGVRRAALEYGAIGEETEFSPLVDHVQKGLRPDPRPTPMGIARAVGSGRFSRRKPPTERDVADRIALVDQAVEQVMVIEASESGGGPEIERELADVNRQLEPVRRVLATHRIVFDVKHEAGENARKLLRGVAALAGVATGLQAAGAGEAAILTAEAGEDALQGLVEGASQEGAMRTPGEVWRRGTKLAAAGALAGSAALAGPIHHLAESGLGYLAGPLMGVGSMALSGVVFGNAVQLNYKGRVERLRAGKVANTVPTLMFDATFQRSLEQIGKRPAKTRRQLMLKKAHAALDHLVADGTITSAERTRTMSALEGTRDLEHLQSMVKMPTRRALLRTAFSEALGTPTRKALGQGMVITIVASSVVGAIGLLSGPAWGLAVATLAAAGEGIWGLYRSFRFEKENNSSREKTLRAMAAGGLRDAARR